MFGFKSEELLIVLVIILILFGGKKLPELSKGIGQALKEIRKGLTGDVHEDAKREDKKQPEK
jgi:sec-independent protein translocase protein TatA